MNQTPDEKTPLLIELDGDDRRKLEALCKLEARSMAGQVRILIRHEYARLVEQMPLFDLNNQPGISLPD